jgi:hypothetical protein
MTAAHSTSLCDVQAVRLFAFFSQSAYSEHRGEIVRPSAQLISITASRFLTEPDTAVYTKRFRVDFIFMFIQNNTCFTSKYRTHARQFPPKQLFKNGHLNLSPECAEHLTMTFRALPICVKIMKLYLQYVTSRSLRHEKCRRTQLENTRIPNYGVSSF